MKTSIFLAPLALCHGPVSHASVCALTFILNIFSETTYPKLMKCHRNVVAMVLFRICRTILIPSKTLVAMQGFFLWLREGTGGRQVGKKCINNGKNLLSDI